VASIAGAVAEALGMSRGHVEAVRTAGVLHDIGKLGIPDGILLKPGPLSLAEWAVMRHHAALGAEIVAGAGMVEIALWVRHHHERLDGLGYPDRLAGEEIPLESRILHAADALEAMTAARVYRPALPLDEALAEVELNAATQFDPDVADCLIELTGSESVLDEARYARA
jgi:putative nucleotidyltransferase with HDIG domain